MPLLTPNEVRERLRAATDAAGSQRKFAHRWGVRECDLSQCLNGRISHFPRKVLLALGLEKVTRYKELR